MKKSLSVLAFLLTAFAVMAQKQASGVVSLSDTGEPEPGVTVVVTGTTSGTITDFDGNFQLTVPEGKTIEISYTGYKKVTLQPGSGMNVVLEPDDMVLEEVVAVGYGVMKKSDLTGAISSVKSEQLQRTPASGVDQALQGRAAGVTVNAGSGQPGQKATIRIRGIGTANSSNDPVYVVDGAIVTDISFLSPNDIASMEVLKDASSTAIYGSRAANGVILITTKKGSKDRPASISFSAYWGWNNMTNTLDVLGRDDLAMTITKIKGDRKQLAALYAGDFNKWWSLRNGDSPYFPANFDYSQQETDWQDAIQNKNAFVHNYHLSIDGGSEKGSYALSASYFSQEGTIIGSDYERMTLRLNSDLKVRDWLKVGENLSFMISNAHNAMNNSGTGKSSMLTAALSMAPWDPVAYPEGTVSNAGEDLSGKYAAASNFTNTTNPYNMTYQHNSKDKGERWVGDLYLEIMPVKGLTIRPSISIDLANNRSSNFSYAYFTSTNDKFERDRMSSDYNHYLTWINDNVVTYDKEINKHHFTIMAGESMEQFMHNSLNASAADFTFKEEQYQYVSMGVTDSTKKGSDGVSRTRRLSAFSRLFYSYDSRYMITFNFRADGSSKFNKKYMWGYFPSLSLAWRLKNESWLKDNEILHDLKLRAGWGRTGNDQIGDDTFVLKVNQPGPYFVGYVLGKSQITAPGAAVTTLVNADGHWEATETWDAGVDFSLWGGKLSATADFFCRDTKDMLFTVKKPAQVGNMWDPTFNVGTCRNIGAELTLEHANEVNGFEYNISLNLSYVKNYIRELNGGEPIYNDPTIVNEGYAINTFYGYEYEGVYQTDEEAASHLWATESALPHMGDARFTDQNKDGKIDEKDKVDLGNCFPDLTGGLNFEANYKGFDLQIFFQGSVGNKLYNYMRQYLEGPGDQNTILSSEMLDGVWYYFSGDKAKALESANVDWRSWNTNAYIPNPNGHANNSATSSRFVEDASYLRLKNVTFGYTLPKHITQKAHINRLRFYVSGSNLFTITGYKGYDPEVGGDRGVDYGNYPQSRTLMFGMNLDF